MTISQDIIGLNHVRHHHLPTPTVAPRCLPGLTFPDFDLAPKRNEKFGYCALDMVGYSAGE